MSPGLSSQKQALATEVKGESPPSNGQHWLALVESIHKGELTGMRNCIASFLAV